MNAIVDTNRAVDQRLLAEIVERIEALNEQQSITKNSLQAIYAKAKDAGFQIPILREIIRERAQDDTARNTRYNLLDAYRQALGMLADTPLGQAALDRDTYHDVKWPTPFAQQTVHKPRRRGRPRKSLFNDDPNGSDELPPAA